MKAEVVIGEAVRGHTGPLTLDDPVNFINKILETGEFVQRGLVHHRTLKSGLTVNLVHIDTKTNPS
jgi:aspartate oxidase